MGQTPSAEKNSSIVSDLSNRIGDFIEYWGFKKIHGRIWTHIYLAPKPIDATTLIKRLSVSKALVSLSIADLLAFQVIQEVGKGPRRTIYYAANPDLSSVIVNVLRLRERKMLSQMKSACQKLEDTTKSERLLHGIDCAKLEKLRDLVCGAQDALDAWIGVAEPGSDLSGQLQLVAGLGRLR